MGQFHGFTQQLTVLGHVIAVVPDDMRFVLRTRSTDEVHIYVGETTDFRVLQNLDGLDRDRIIDPVTGERPKTPEERVRSYVREGGLIAVQGIFQEEADLRRFDGRTVHLLHSEQGHYLFEDTHWWLNQIARMADEWLDDLFRDRRTYQQDDFAELYRTNLNILGLPAAEDADVQECATLSRLIYGLSSAYLLTGVQRYFLAAKAGVQYQRETFRTLSHDGRYCFWSFGKRRGPYGSKMVVASENEDDRGTIPLYEQIYALAGLAQYYRITADWEVLADIRRTVQAFNEFYLDEPGSNRDWATGHGGYMSHVDYATMRPDTLSLDDNRMRKNWNSIGDHIPAYLVNLVLALHPVPKGRADHEAIASFRDECRSILDRTSDLIIDKFPDDDESIPYVHERFHADWSPDESWRWQRDRAIVGHNLKIAWNLTRVAMFYDYVGDSDRAKRAMDLAERLGKTMVDAGCDQIRGGIFDAVERQHDNSGIRFDFPWSNTKDFWQQEQAILAYLILYGYTRNPEYRELAREMSAFWNLFFLDHDNRGIFFRVLENGLPYLVSNYMNKGGHSVSGYHAFELNYLAHLYTRLYLSEDGDENFCLYFRPDRECGQLSMNVLPDFVRPGDVTIAGIAVNGIPRSTIDHDNFQIELNKDELGAEVVVEFTPRRR